MNYRFDKIPPPPTVESFQEQYRWNYRVFELLNGVIKQLASNISVVPVSSITATDVQGAVEQLIALTEAHKSRHEKGGADEISVSGLSGLLADEQTPLAHKTSHENGGVDELNVEGLSGELADQQPPKVAGSDTHVQYNDNGVIGGAAAVRYDKATGTLRIGGATDYTEIEADGTLKFAGDGTAWDDSMVPANAFRGGVTSLTFDALTTNVYSYRMDLNDEAHLIVQFPHSLKVGSVVSPHIHLVNKNAIGATGYNVAFDFKYIWANINGVFAAEQQELNVKQSFQNASALTHKMLAFSSITPSAAQGGISSIFACSVKRVAASTEPYNTNDIFTLGFDIHFEKDTVGSREPASK